MQRVQGRGQDNAHRGCREKLALSRQLLGSVATQPDINQLLPRDHQSLYETVTGQSLLQCPACGTGTMKLNEYLAPLSGVLTFTPQSHSTLAPQAIDSS